MTADIDLPVWSLRPNWRDGIRERLEWLTDVETSSEGAEQAIAYRLSPRRSFEVLFSLADEDRSYFDLWLHRMGQFEFMVPLWHDNGRLSAPILGGTETIPVDTTYREFTVGGLALIAADNDPFSFDKVEILAVADDGLTVSPGGVTRDWAAKSSIFPLRRSRLAQESQVSALVNRAGEASILFELNQANDLADEGEWTLLEYLTYPVLTTEPNWREQIDMSFVRNSLLLDNDIGLREIADDAGRAFTLQAHSFMLNGRAGHWSFRQMLYRLRGQQGAIWIPTYNRDFVLSRDRLAADSLLDIKKIGYAYTGGVVNGRNHVLIDRSTPAEITDVDVALSATEERLTLAAPLGSNFAAGTTGSFLDTARLSQDMIEILHHTDTDGVAECNIAFKTFADVRTEDEPIDYPIPTTAERTVECGEEEPPAWRVDIPFSVTINMPNPLPDCYPAAHQPPVDYLLFWSINITARLESSGIRQFILGGNISGDGTYSDFVNSVTQDMGVGLGNATVTATVTINAGSITFDVTSDTDGLQMEELENSSDDTLYIDLQSGVCLDGFTFDQVSSDQVADLPIFLSQPGTTSGGGLYDALVRVGLWNFMDGQP